MKVLARDAEIFDCDGTFVNVLDIRHHVLGKERNFHKFHRESVNCPPNPDVVAAAVRAHEEGRAVLVVTARTFQFAMHTMWWLRFNLPIPYDQLYMRKDGDYRPDYEVKKDILAMIRRDGYNVVRAWDDNPNVIKLWREEGIPDIRIVEGFGFE